MKSQVLHTVRCYISSKAAWEVWDWSLLGVLSWPVIIPPRLNCHVWRSTSASLVRERRTTWTRPLSLSEFEFTFGISFLNEFICIIVPSFITKLDPTSSQLCKINRTESQNVNVLIYFSPHSAIPCNRSHPSSLIGAHLNTKAQSPSPSGTL